MPMYMDEHDIPGVKAADVVGAHAADVAVQGKYGVDYKHYWVDEEKGKVFCLVDAPDRETATGDEGSRRGPRPHRPHAVRGRAGRLRARAPASRRRDLASAAGVEEGFELSERHGHVGPAKAEADVPVAEPERR